MNNQNHSPTPWRNAGNYAVDANGDYVKSHCGFVKSISPNDAQADENEALMFVAVNAVVEAAAIAGVDPMEYAKNLPEMEKLRRAGILAEGLSQTAPGLLKEAREYEEFKNWQRAEHGGGNV